MRHVEVLGRCVKLTCKEFEILLQLIRRPRIIFSKKQIARIILGDEHRLSDKRLTHTISSHLKKLRKKLVPKNPELARKLIQTIYDSGYRLNDLRKGRQ